MTVLDALIAALRDASAYNRNDAVAPAAILWTDGDRHWEPVVRRLHGKLPVLTLGRYDPEGLTGPVIWLRCMVAGTLADSKLPDGTPILYLPGVSRQLLRAVETCRQELQPLLELQFRGTFFSQRNARDWTPHAFLQGHLGITVKEDQATRAAIARSITTLIDETVEGLRARAPLDAAFFNELLSPDPARQLLAWLDAPQAQRVGTDADGHSTWAAFEDICRTRYGFDPSTDGPIAAAELLGQRQGEWKNVWQRFSEAPTRYPNLPEVLRRAGQGKSDPTNRSEAWPQDNEAEEKRLQQALVELRDKPPDASRHKVADVEREHGLRRGWVWRELGMAPLASALEALSRVMEYSSSPLGRGSPAELAERYVETGYQVDRAALEALAAVERQADAEAIRIALEALYRPWLEEGAKAFQEAVERLGPPKPSASVGKSPGRCILFTDGLRFDVASKLASNLQGSDADVELSWTFSALPGVTATAKPAVAPVECELSPGEDFSVKAAGTAVTAQVLRRHLEEAGFELLHATDTGSPEGAAWTEYGNLDSLGHNEGWKLAQRLDKELGGLAERIAVLLTAGWQEVKVVTDHGWLLLPFGFSTVKLPEHLTIRRKGRCARLKKGSQVEYQTVPWHFDEEVRIAVAPGIDSFTAGSEYEHGGLSVQECVLPVLTVRSKVGASTISVEITTLKWRGLRLRASVDGAPAGARADLRTKAADAASSIAANGEPKPIADDGTVSLVVPDDELEGTAAHLVILDTEGSILAQRTTTVGG